MGRPLRIEVPSGIYHLGSKGNYAQAIYLDDFDRVMHETMLERVVNEFEWRVLASCQMTNHFHLVIRIRDEGLSDGMCLLNGHYARYVHRRYGRRGHLFQAPFYSRLIEMDADLLETCTYVVNNPVRAGICRTAAQWKWSTYRATAGFDHPPPYLALDELLPLLGRTPAAARRAYREHVAFRQVPVPGTGSSS